MLGRLVTVLDEAALELFAIAPFPGEPQTGRQIDGYVDATVSAMRSLRTQADELHRALEIRRNRPARDQSRVDTRAQPGELP